MKNSGMNVDIGVVGGGLWGAHGAGEAWLKALESGRSAVTMHRFGNEMPFAAAPGARPMGCDDDLPLDSAPQMMLSAAREALSNKAPLPTKVYLAAADGAGNVASVDVVSRFIAKTAPLVGVEHRKNSDVVQVGRLFRQAVGDLGSGSVDRAVLVVLHRGVEPENVGRLRADKSLAATPARAMSFVHGHEGLAPADGCGVLVLERTSNDPDSPKLGDIEVGAWSKDGTRPALATLIFEERKAVPDILFVSGTRNSRDDKDLLDAIKEAFGGLLVPIRSLDDIGGYGCGAGVVFGVIAAQRALRTGILSKRKAARAGVVVLDADADVMVVTSLTRAG